MAGLNVQAPIAGINAQVPRNLLEPEEAAIGSENCLYEDGLIKRAFGFTPVDMTADGLNSNDPVLSIFSFKETDGYGHLMAVTTDKIFARDRVNSDWDDRTQSGWVVSSNVDTPVSHIVTRHNDATIYLNDLTTRSVAYSHLLVCDGGLSNIQRWAGRYEDDFGDLLGGGDYHDGLSHRALQVSQYKSRVILINPRAYNSASQDWVKNLQRVRWSVVGKIETWTGTGSGFVDLLETGGINVKAASLGTQFIIYQDMGIWSLDYVGGTSVFTPTPQITDLGLLSSKLLVPKGNIHYFVGSDYNVYAYYGGTATEIIGDKIQSALEDDLNDEFQSRSFMAMEPKNKRLWIFIVDNSNEYVHKAYVMDMKTGVWQVRDFSGYYSNGSTGLLAADVAGAFTFVTGDSYSVELNKTSLYDSDPTQDTAGDTTIRYGDYLLDASRSITKDYTSGVWSAGGFDYSKAAEVFTADITENDMLVTYDGSLATNLAYGQHYYTVYDVSTNGFSIKPTADGTEPDRGVADNSTNVPADLSVSGQDTIGFFSPCGQTYRQIVQENLSGESFIVGDTSGFIYQMNETYTTEYGSTILSRHVTPVFDFDTPDSFKRWTGFVVDAKGDSIKVSYRIGNYETSETGWTDFTQELTSEFNAYTFWHNISSKNIQYKFSSISGDDFEIRGYKLLSPEGEWNR